MSKPKLYFIERLVNGEWEMEMSPYDTPERATVWIDAHRQQRPGEWRIVEYHRVEFANEKLHVAATGL